GYDLHKVQIGALGTLGLIAEATFKVAPQPERVGALLLGCASREQALALAARLQTRPLGPSSMALLTGRALDVCAAGWPNQHSNILLAVRFDGVAAAVERQVRLAKEHAADLDTPHAETGDEGTRALWQRLAQFPRPGEQAEVLLRAGARPSALGAVLEALEGCAPTGAAWTIGYSGVGVAHAGWQSGGTMSEALARLRAELVSLQSYAVVEAAPAGLHERLDIWGAPPATLPLMQALKQQWDPHGSLNRGRYVGGI
ncbi:MAG TPA: FAD-linked oxidase C-terminal domain-containing protein, partial [Roseiflexaceae bacterium]|nr:FAD-linked oxidase C-terminal domain-containing protein [Roseiflexaceae bacterium]